MVYVCSLLVNPPVYCFPYTPFNSCNNQNPVELILTEALLRARTLTSIQTRKLQVLPHAEHSLSPPDNIHLLRTSCETHKYIMQQKATFPNVTAGGTDHTSSDGLPHPGEGSVLMRCGGVLTVRRTTGLLLVGATLLCSCIQTENIKHFEERVVSDCTVRMLSAWVVATLDSRRNFAHAQVSHS